MPQEVVDYVAAAGASQKSYTSIDKILPSTDVLYITRIQKEQFDSEDEYNKVKAETPFIFIQIS